MCFPRSNGLSNVSDLVFTDNSIYASSSDGALYHLVDEAGSISKQTEYRNGDSGIRGLAGASSVTVSDDGKYVFVAGKAESSIAVFTRNAATGELSFAQVSARRTSSSRHQSAD